MYSDVAKAREYALRAHGDQKYGSLPYFSHLEDVAEIVLDYARIYPRWAETAFVVAYLHDILEDTHITVDDLEDEFDPDIVALVDLVTDPPGANRAERKSKLHGRLCCIQPGSIEEIALAVKAADRLANIRACRVNGRKDLLEMYRAEHREFEFAVYRIWLSDIFEQITTELSSRKRLTS